MLCIAQGRSSVQQWWITLQPPMAAHWTGHACAVCFSHQGYEHSTFACGGGHLSDDCDLHNYGCAYGLRLQPNDYIRIAAPANRIANGPDPNIDIWLPMLQMDRSEYWHLVIWVPMLQMDRSNIDIWSFGYQCCEWIDLNIDIWVPMLQMDRSEYWHLAIFGPH